jgi:hypothetical protein
MFKISADIKNLLQKFTRNGLLVMLSLLLYEIEKKDILCTKLETRMKITLRISIFVEKTLALLFMQETIS